ncbi:PSD1 and planctomycete cytochrome C domain-containing protein, partial [Planctomycetota bacterium]
LCVSASVADANATPEQLVFFENKIRPLLVDRCFECHNEDVQESGLRLDSLQAMVEGGERGPAIVIGKSQQSLLIHSVNHSEADLQMPEGDKLTANEIQDLTKWIDMGAPWPGQSYVESSRKNVAQNGFSLTEEEKSFWAFVRPTLPQLPAIKNETWVQSDLDRFVLARLEAEGLTPAPPATKRALVRRTYFDLIGLPPTPAQVNAFLADDSPDALERLIDSLLATPQYGERWGRHWLDVARYADSNGLDENMAFEFIYKYRDWVIQAFNDDLPYDEFVVHQLAGDLIKQTDDETAEDYIHRVKAVGFLSVGPKMIADDDPKKKKLDIIDEQLNTLSQAFMAMTMGCARCHDHKFDPIPAWDYYAMASILKSTKTMEHLRVVAPIGLHALKPTGYDEAFAAYDSRRKKLLERRNEFLRPILGEKFDAAIKDPTKIDSAIPEDRKQTWNEIKTELSEHEETKPQLEKVMAVTEGDPEDLRVLLRGNYLSPGEQTKRQFLRIIDGEAAEPLVTNGSGRLELARWLASEDHPLTARVFVNRVWRWRFGAGIVATPDNFGRLGARPTHPALLDWLAVTFVSEDNWSLKRLHKRMMLSSTYQMSSRFNERAAAIDPTNALWWRFPRKRLEAEAIRDAILHVSDGLDLTVGGSLMPLKDRAYVTGTASKTQRYDNPRRTIYQPVYRSAVYDVLSSFDFPDPATLDGDRSNSVVAPQALLMMNSSLVEKSAERLAAKLLANWSNDGDRIAALYERAYSRPPRDSETSAILRHLQSAGETDANSEEASQVQLRVWRGVCRTIIAASEFLYLD